MSRGVVAAGHPVTADAARDTLAAGGNAFDAVLAAMLAACVAEPVLASLGGGGFLLAHPAGSEPEVFDFFVQTPLNQRPLEEIDFRPIVADFGSAQQEFHIGLGTIATPGVVAGFFDIHGALGTLPAHVIAGPAIEAAREGVVVNGFQHYIATIVAPILNASPAALSLHACADHPGDLAAKGTRLTNPALADTLETLCREGAGVFYAGEIGQSIARACREDGGWLCAEDLQGYRTVRRRPLCAAFGGHRLFLNPPPSIGGTLLAFALGLLDGQPACDPATDTGIVAIADAMAATQTARRDHRIDFGVDEALAQRMLAPDNLARYRRAINGAVSTRGTTHISVADQAGNLASLTLSNGEGSGFVAPGSGIMLNNMLGEEDLNARGFHRWPTGTRVSSMMSPTLAHSSDGDWYALGSGGSNRIRSAILQTLLHVLAAGRSLDDAVHRPRVHVENDHLSVEAGFPESAVGRLRERFPEHHLWPTVNLFFGGAHSVLRRADGSIDGAGDPRRGGVAAFA
jgi:gamma-glutamyltranspeptidase/glutathione hydrolase